MTGGINGTREHHCVSSWKMLQLCTAINEIMSVCTYLHVTVIALLG